MKKIERFKIGLQYLIPQHILTRLMGRIASAKLGKFTTFCIRRFAKHYKVDMTEASHMDFAHYRTFNEFFTRALAEGVRPIAEGKNVLTHPADACVSQFGPIEEGTIFQAKGHNYTVLDLLGGDEVLAAEFQHGQFATLYLSPRDYHRVHMPCDGILRKMTFVAGDLFSVNPLTAQHVPNLFARNERLVCVFDTDFGPMVQVLVGATIVGSMEVTWKGEVRASEGRMVTCWNYPVEGDGVIRIAKGQEMGRFKLGSTVINLFPKDVIAFDDSMSVRTHTRMGTAYAHRVQDGN